MIFVRNMRSEWPFLLLLGAYILAVVWLTGRIPAFSGPNEGLHYEVSALWARSGAPPSPALSTRADERHQPPLYYAFTQLPALFFDGIKLDTDYPGNPHYVATHRGNLNAKLVATPSEAPLLYAGRLISLLFGIAGVVALYVAGRLTFSAPVSLLIAALLAFQPNYLYLSSMLSNDGAVAAMAAILLGYTTWLSVKVRPTRTVIGWGLLFAAAMLTKANAVVLALTFVAPWLTLARKAGRRQMLGAPLVALCAFGPVWGGWLLYNRSRAVDLLAIERSLPLDRVLRLSPADLPLIRPHLATLWRSFWLDWSAGEVGFAPDWAYLTGLALTVVALLGWAFPRRFGRRTRLLAAMHAAVVAALGLLFLSVKTLMVKETGFLVAEGRWMTPMMPSLAWLIGVGWSRLWPQQLRGWAAQSAAAALALAVLLLATWQIPQLYPRVQRLETAAGASMAAESPPVLLYDGQLALHRVVIDDTLQVGEETPVDLIWEVLSDPQEDLTVSYQLLAPNGASLQKLDVQNSLPGSGTASTVRWRAGEWYRDRMILKPAAGLNGPTLAGLGVWLLDDYRSSSALTATRAGLEVDPPFVAELIVYPAHPPHPPAQALLTTPVRFGEHFQLLATQIEAVQSGARLTLWWQTDQPTSVDYTVFAHLLDDAQLLLEQADGPPDAGRSPTTIWRQGDVIRDVRDFATPLPAGA